MFDVIIAGGGPAGLSAALVLGRCCRRVLLCDDGRPRNAVSQGLHGFLTRDGIHPAELLRIGREQLRPYAGVEVRGTAVLDARPGREGFQVLLADHDRLSCRKFLLATGLADELPPVPGLASFYGRSAFHCPYCDGWEVRGQPLAAYGRGKEGFGLALELTAWTRDLVLCTDGPAGLGPGERRRLARHRVELREEPIERLEGEDGFLKRIVFRDGSGLARRALFFKSHWRQRSDLATRLGCKFTPGGAVQTREGQSDDVPGIYVAGDAAVEGGLAIIAAAEGARAAVAINTELVKEDLARRERPFSPDSPPPEPAPPRRSL